MRQRSRHLRYLLLRLGLLMVLFTALRWVFFIANRSAFPAFGFVDGFHVQLQGLRFDAMTVVLAHAVFILLHLLPLAVRDRSGYQRLLFVLFIAVNTFLLVLCSIDLPFYGFNGKRITRDVLGQLQAGARGLPGFVVHYWWAALVFLSGVILLVRGWRWIGVPERTENAVSRKEWWVTVPALLVLALIGRGGWQYQGLSPAHAADHVPVALAPLVTNSAFTFGYSLTRPALQARAYMSTAELDARMPLRYALKRDSTDRRTNVVLLIVESLGREYVGALNGGKGYTPFLDSLCGKSLVLTNAYANAERSNKSMCALLAGIPSFTDDAFMNTAYSADRVQGLGTGLKKLGYSTAFFHGGINGEYKFDSFSRACGFDRYFGKDEFANDALYDGHWGIYDEEFLQFVAQRLGELPEPFGAVEFTLSSHDPFPIPPRYAGVFPKGEQEIHASIGYTDMALRRFFATAEKQPWFANTLFVITGDHTFQYNDHPLWYRNPAGRFAVPIIFYKADGSYSGTDDRLSQHLDILPSILDRVGYDGEIFAFGQSVFKRDRTDRAVQFLGGQYRLIQDDRELLFDGQRTQGLFNYRTDTLFAKDLRSQERATETRMRTDLEAIIQLHAQAVIDDRLVAP